MNGGRAEVDDAAGEAIRRAEPGSVVRADGTILGLPAELEPGTTYYAVSRAGQAVAFMLPPGGIRTLVEIRHLGAPPTA